MYLPSFPGPTFIPCPMSIPESRVVYNMLMIIKLANTSVRFVIHWAAYGTERLFSCVKFENDHLTQLNQTRPNYFWTISSKNDHCLPGNHRAKHLTSKKKQKKREVLSFFALYHDRSAKGCGNFYQKFIKSVDFLVQLIFYL